MISKTSFLTEAAAEGIIRATERWKVLWDSIAEADRNNPLIQVGFTRHVPELCWLTRAIVKVSQIGDKSCTYMDMAPTESVSHLHDFVDKYKGTSVLPVTHMPLSDSSDRLQM